MNSALVSSDAMLTLVTDALNPSNEHQLCGKQLEAALTLLEAIQSHQKGTVCTIVQNTQF